MSREIAEAIVRIGFGGKASGPRTYTYRRYKGDEELFSCEASTITEADAKMILETGIDPAKDGGIGCWITSPK